MTLKFIFWLIVIAGINEGFKDWKRRARYKNTNPELVKLDSLISKEIDSLIVTYKK